jgi:hypothetical protein
MAKTRTELTLQNRRKFKEVRVLFDFELVPGLEKLKKEFGSMNKGIKELVKKYMQKD